MLTISLQLTGDRRYDYAASTLADDTRLRYPSAEVTLVPPGPQPADWTIRVAGAGAVIHPRLRAQLADRLKHILATQQQEDPRTP